MAATLPNSITPLLPTRDPSLQATGPRSNYLKFCYQAVCDAISCEIDAEYNEPDSVQLVAVSKFMPASDIQVLYDLGHRHFGENYVQELVEKAEILPKDIKWHFIGSLQTNKCKTLAGRIPNLYAIETVDSQAKAQKLNDSRDTRFGVLNIYLQVNTSGEEQKGGLVDDNAVYNLSEYIIKYCPNLHLKGIMTIGSISRSFGSGENQDFRALATLGERLSQKTNRSIGLSMGMSKDYLEAIRQGSTNVRVGRTIFGQRPVRPAVHLE